eukprot:g8205.t1
MGMGGGNGMYNTGGGAGCIGGGLGTMNMTSSNGLMMNFSPHHEQQHIHNLMQFHQSQTSQSQNMMMGGNYMMQMQSVEQDNFEEFQLDEEAQEGNDEKLFLGSGGDQHQHQEDGENFGLWAGDEMNVDDHDDHDWTREIDVDGQGAGQGKGSEHYHDFSGEFLEGAEDDGGEQHQDVEMENFFDEEQNHNFNYGGEVDEVPDAREAPEPAGAEDERAEDDEEGMQNSADVQQMQMMYNAQLQLQQMMTLPSAVSEARSKVIFCRASRHQVSGTAAGTKTWMAMHGGVTQYDDE